MGRAGFTNEKPKGELSTAFWRTISNITDVAPATTSIVIGELGAGTRTCYVR